MAGNDHLAGRIEIHGFGNANAGRIFTNSNDGVVVESQYRSHRADTGGYGVLHKLGPAHNNLHRIFKAYGIGTYQGRIFAKAVSCHLCWLGTAPDLPHAICGDAGSHHCGLRDECLCQFLCRTILYQMPQVVTEHRARLRVSFLDDREFSREVGLHTRGLGTLSGKYHCCGQDCLRELSAAHYNDACGWTLILFSNAPRTPPAAP